MRLWVAVAIAVISATCCAETAESPEPLTQVVQLAGAESGTELIQWEPLPDRAIVVYSVRGCAEPQCETTLATLHAVDERGEPWFIAILEEGATFEIGEEGSEVSVLSADGSSTRFSVESPAPTVAVSEGDEPIAQFGGIDGLSPHNEPVAVLADGRYLIRGSWDQDEPMESWVMPMQGERSSQPRRPIRLFLYDPGADLLTPVSEIPASREVSTAVSTSYGPDTVLRVELLPGDRSVAYSVGFNGAAYDIEYSLYLAPLPSP